MLKIETYFKLEDLESLQNIAEKLTAQERDDIGRWAAEGFEADLQSRTQWEDRMKDAMKLALQLKEQKSFPWAGASNVKMPLITVSAMSFHSRIYPALIQQPAIVECRTFGDDPSGELSDAADLISEHMSWQVFEEDENWEAETDKLFLAMAILGCAFKKSYFDRTLGHNVSELVLPSDLVIDYWTKSLSTAQRITHIRYLSQNEIVEKERQGFYCKYEECGVPSTPELLGALAKVRDELQGTTPDPSDRDQPIVVLEQCCWMDLDCDGYKEPYVVTFRHDNSKVLRIRAAFFRKSVTYNSKREVVNIQAEQAYTKYEFIPSPDGGFYSLGFGSLLGPLSQSIDTSINQLIDAGTMKNAGGGFLGRGIRVKGGEYTFSPSVWKRVDSAGIDLQKNIYPLPVPEPSSVLLQLLSILLQYGEKIAGATEATAGDNPGQNTKVGTMDAMLEQGLTIFSGIYKRAYRSLRDEFRKLYRLNQLYLNESQEFQSNEGAKKILAKAYSLPSSAIRPAADPSYMSDQQRQRQARLVKEAASTSSLYNPLEVEKWFLKTMKIPGVDKLLVKEVPPPSPPIQLQVEQMRLQAKMAELQAQQAQSQLDFRLKLLDLTNEAELNQAQIIKLQAQALLLVEQAGTTKTSEEIALIDSQIGAAKLHHDGLLKAIKVLSDVTKQGREDG